MLKLTKKADYGLIALRHLAAHQARGTASAKELAEEYCIPLALLSKVLQILTKQGYLISEQGTNGGYRLARSPEKISALDVIRTIDGPVFLTACFTDTGKECGQSSRCTVREPLRKVHEGIIRMLASLTLAEMAREERAELPVELVELIQAPALRSEPTRTDISL